MERLPNLIAIASAALVLSGCMTTQVDRMPMAEGVLGAYEVDESIPQAIRAGDQVLGYVSKQRFEVPSGERRQRYEISDDQGQAVGYVDANGRAFRYEPFEEPRHVTTDSLTRAVEAVLNVDRGSSPVRIVTAAMPPRDQ